MARRTWEQYEKYLIQRWPLTGREVRIALECIKGRKNREIACALEISAETVNKHLDHIYRITGARGRDQLAAELLIADLENTPLQQSLSLAGEGGAVVRAGFVDTLYSSRTKRERQRSLRASALASRKAADQSPPVGTPAVDQHLATFENPVTVADVGSPTSRRWPQQVRSMKIEDESWLPCAEFSMTTKAGDS